MQNRKKDSAVNQSLADAGKVKGYMYKGVTRVS